MGDGALVGINNGVGGTIGVGINQAAKAFGEQPSNIIAPAPMPAILRKSRRESARPPRFFMNGFTQRAILRSALNPAHDKWRSEPGFVLGVALS